MRPLAPLLAILLVAGCLDERPSDPSLTQPDEAGPETNWPEMDTAGFLERYEAFITAHPRRLGEHPDHEAARQHILERFTTAGLDVWRHDFGTGSNLVGLHWGTDRDRWVVVGAHYDMVHPDCTPGALEAACTGVSQGAYDNGSGTSLMLELAETFAGVATVSSIAFVAFDDHESEGLQGSLRWIEAVQEGATPWGEAGLDAALVLDMFGLTWPGIDAPHPRLRLRVPAESGR